MKAFLMAGGTMSIPLFQSTIQAGFPSPAQDYMEEDIDLQKMLIRHPLATFIIRVKGDSMVGAFIPEDALLIVDKSLKPKNRDIIVAVVNGEFTVKRLVKSAMKCVLQAENPTYKPIEITGDMEFVVWGVVTQILIDPK
ncbi:MAG: translesion error-prone DNA polymerase V autoproteolytic subunit [Ginsengibacter sp.]